MQGVTFWAFFLDIRAQNTSKLYLPTFPESNKWDFHLHITLIPKNVRTDEFQTLQKMSEARVELLKMFWWFQNIAAEVISEDCHSLETNIVWKIQAQHVASFIGLRILHWIKFTYS